MTLEQAIKYYEDELGESMEEYQNCYDTHDNEGMEEAKERGEKHEELVKWLKELKAIKEEKDCNNIEETVSTLEYIKEYCHADYEEDALDKAIEMFSKCEFHADHTDCTWYRSDKKHTDCPITCSQYRDGWNDAMRYIYKNGNGYKPYRRKNK